MPATDRIAHLAGQETAALREFNPAYVADGKTGRGAMSAPMSGLPESGRLALIAAIIRGTGVTEYWIGTAASVQLDVRGPDHLAPLHGLVGDELAEVGRRPGADA
jgi:hypothetical protein